MALLSGSLPVEEEGSYGADVSALADGEHTVAVEFGDIAGNITSFDFTIFTDKTDPETEILSPVDGTQLNGTIEVYGSIKDLSLDSWALAVVREDGTADYYPVLLPTRKAGIRRMRRFQMPDYILLVSILYN